MTEPIRGLVAAIARGPVAGAAADLVERLVPWSPGTLAILTYHRVDEVGARPDLMPSLLSATPDGFAEQMAVLASRYRPVSLAEVITALRRPERLPPRAVLVTFDDAYADFAAHAWPIMAAAGIPATLFVPTASSADPSRPFWWDRIWAACRASRGPALADPSHEQLATGSPAACGRTVRALRDRLKSMDHDAAMAEVERVVAALGEPAAGPPAVLDWPALRRLAEAGVTLAPHSRSHPLLDRVPFDRAVQEIVDSAADLEREVGSVARVLAYPSGAHGGRAVEAAREAGMVAGLTTTRGGNDLRRADPFRLRRINVGLRAHAPLIRAQLTWAASVDLRRHDRATRRG